MKYKCKECGTVFTPDKFSSECPKCGSWSLEVIYEHVHKPTVEAAPRQE